MKDNDDNKKNPEFYQISCNYKKLPPQKPPNQKLSSGTKGRIERGSAFWPQTVTNENKLRLIAEVIAKKSFFSYFMVDHVLPVFHKYKNNPKLA